MTPRACIAAAVLTLTLALPFVLGGCGLPTPQGPTGPVTSYVLTPRPPADAALAAAALPASLAPGLVGVQTAQIPDYLAQRPIVSRTEANRLLIAEDAQWAGDLAANITDVVVANLGTLLGGSRVLRLPVSPAVPVATVVGIEISTFEREPSGTVRLAARWIVLGDGGRSFRRIDDAVYEATATGGDYPAITAAMSALLSALSADIAVSLAAPPAAGPPRQAGPAARPAL